MAIGADYSVGVEELLSICKEFYRTSTVSNLKDKSVVFVKSAEWLWRLKEALDDNNKQVIAFCDAIFWNDQELEATFKMRARPIFLWDMMEKFVRFHNEVNRHRQPASHEFATNCKIHPSVVIGVEGMRYIRKDGKTIAMKHMGNVILRSGVEVGAYSVIHRATIDSTIVGKSTKIGNNVSIGHNVVIGEDCMVTPLTVIGGSCVIGDNVWIGMQTAIADNIRVCGDVKLGMGSLVVKDITVPGLYFGCPATRKGDWDGSL